jgi:DNA polymerase I-like protein with 3'-5' exonuclease and polymerase domains
MAWQCPQDLPDLSSHSLIAIDTETCDPDLKELGPSVRRGGFIVGISVAVPGKQWYFPFDHRASGKQLPRSAVISWAKAELCRKGQAKVGANIIYDLDYLYEAGVPVAGPFYDVQHAEAVLDDNRRTYNLDSLALAYLGEGKDEELLFAACEARGWRRESAHSHIWELPPEYVGPYAEADANRTLRVFEKQRALLKEDGLWDLFELEERLIPLLLAMRRRGVRIDTERVKSIRLYVQEKRNAASEALNRIAGREVDFWAAESLAVAFDSVGVEYNRTEKTNAPQFRQGWLGRVSHPIGAAVLDARRWDKLLGTFLESSILSNEINGKIHTQFHQLRTEEYGTVTGRFSSSNPNMQFVPSRDEELGPMIRSLFVPEAGELWGRADYSQIELRILAHYARGEGSEKIRDIFNADPDVDFHAACAEMVHEAGGFGDHIDKKQQRKLAKAINFGVVYGMGVAKLAASLGLPEAEARELLGNYHRMLPFIKRTMYEAGDVARDRGHVKTILGRRRRFIFFEPSDWNLSVQWRQANEPTTDGAAVLAWIRSQPRPRGGIKRAFTYKALNAVIQGSAADLMKKAMLDIWESGVCDVLGPPLLTIHDELDWSVPDTKEGREAFSESIRIMENAIKFKVPIVVEAELKADWGSQPVELLRSK